MDSYMEELLQTFRDEAEELFESIDSNLMLLEKDMNNPDIINSIFRPVHTLKGSAGMMSLDRTNRLAHAMEDILDKIRNGRFACDSQLINLFFEVADCFKSLSKAEILSLEIPENYEKLLAELHRVLAGKHHVSKESAETEDAGGGSPALKTAGETSGDRDKSPVTAGEEEFFVRIPIHNIDEMMGIVEELFVGKSHFFNLIGRISAAHPYHPIIKSLNLLSRNLDKLTLMLEKKVIDIRKVPLDKELSRFKRQIRDMSKGYGREVRLEIQESSIEIDLEMWKKLSEAIEIVLNQIIEKSIEPPDQRQKTGKNRKGLIRINSQYRDSDILIRIEDDGTGTEIDKSEHFSGIMNSIGGKSSSAEGESLANSCVFRVPIDSSRIEVIYFRSGGSIFAIPVTAIERILKLKKDQVKTVGGKQVIYYSDKVLALMHPMTSSDGMESVDGGDLEKAGMSVVITENGCYVAVLVDEVLGEDKVLVKKLEEMLFDTSQVIGATVMGDGRVVLILNPSAFFARGQIGCEYA